MKTCNRAVPSFGLKVSLRPRTLPLSKANITSKWRKSSSFTCLARWLLAIPCFFNTFNPRSFDGSSSRTTRVPAQYLLGKSALHHKRGGEQRGTSSENRRQKLKTAGEGIYRWAGSGSRNWKGTRLLFLTAHQPVKNLYPAKGFFPLNSI